MHGQGTRSAVAENWLKEILLIKEDELEPINLNILANHQF